MATEPGGAISGKVIGALLAALLAGLVSVGGLAYNSTTTHQRLPGHAEVIGRICALEKISADATAERLQISTLLRETRDSTIRLEVIMNRVEKAINGRS